jgi:hypothetical protein
MNRNAGHQVGSTKTTGGWGAEKQPRSPPNRIHEATLVKIGVHGGRARAELGRNREIAPGLFSSGIAAGRRARGIATLLAIDRIRVDHGTRNDDRKAPMSEADDREPSGGRANLIALAARQPASLPVTFTRQELNTILEVYGRHVADGEWRDYAIDHLRERAVFSIFRRTSEIPLYRIVKDPKLARRQGAYALVAATGAILKRGHELANVLRVIDKPVRLVSA